MKKFSRKAKSDFCVFKSLHEVSNGTVLEPLTPDLRLESGVARNRTATTTKVSAVNVKVLYKFKE